MAIPRLLVLGLWAAALRDVAAVAGERGWQPGGGGALPPETPVRREGLRTRLLPPGRVCPRAAPTPPPLRVSAAR